MNLLLSSAPKNILLKEALQLYPGEVISLVGGGGKTTLMFALAGELEKDGQPAVCTTTTKILPPQEKEGGTLFLSSELGEILSFLNSRLGRGECITVCQEMLPDGKLQGVPPEWVDDLHQCYPDCYIIVEADGSKGRPLKAPGPWEPVFPRSCSLVVAMVGLDGLGAKLSEEKVFRPEMVSRLTGLKLGDVVGLEAIVELFLNPEGLTRGAPPSARVVPFINKVDLEPELKKARGLARALLAAGNSRFDRVILGQAGKLSPVAEVMTG